MVENRHSRQAFNPANAKPGTYDGIPFDEYLKIPAVSNTKLSGMLRSPAFCQMAQAHTEPTPAQQLGTAVHTLVLEPHLFDSQFGRKPEADMRTKAGKEQFECVKAHHPATGTDSPPTWLDYQTFDAAQGMADSITTHPDASVLLKSAQYFEQTTIWLDDGVLCKSRKDLGHVDWIADLKTTRNLQGFKREWDRLGYHRQAAWYMDGEFAVGNKPKAFFFLVVQNTPPFESQVFDVDLLSFDVGRAEARALFERFNECKAKNDWPRHVTGIQSLTVPEWRYRQAFPEEG